MLKQLFDIKLWKFLGVGVINTIVGTAVMFGLYNLEGCSYWLSSSANYVVGGVVSYVLNKRFTFQNMESNNKAAVRFVINIAVCYLVAYGVAKPVARTLLVSCGETIQENVAMLVGMCLFVALNYLGQRFFAFRELEAARDRGAA